MNTRLVAFIPRDKIVNLAENQRQTVLQYAPDSAQSRIYKDLAETIWQNETLSIPTPLEFEELESLVAAYGTEN